MSKADRVKGNAKPSKSSQAADLLAKGSSSTLGFSSFSSFGSEEPEIDSELTVILRKFGKKDTVTRLKAASELQGRIEADSEEDVAKIIQKWAKIFNKLSGDHDRRIREAICQTHMALVLKVKKEVAPHLKSFMSNWLCCIFDPNKEVARLASEAFEGLFTLNKRPQVILFCKDEVFQHVTETLIKETPETMSDPSSTSKEEMQAKYDRMISCSLHVLGYMLETLPADDLPKIERQFQELLSEKKFWGFSKSENPLVRRALYRLISLSCQKRSALVEPHLKVVAQLVLSLGDTDPLTHGELWDAALLVSKELPQSWTAVDARKAIFPKIWKFFQSAGYGSSKMTYSSLLPFLSTIPDEIFGNGPEFALLYLSNLRQGLKAENLSREAAADLLTSFLECLLFISLKKSVSLDTKKEVIDKELGWALDFFFVPHRPQFLPESSLVDMAWMASKISGVVSKISKNPDHISIAELYFGQLKKQSESVFSGVFVSTADSAVGPKNLGSLVSSFLSVTDKAAPEEMSHLRNILASLVETSLQLFATTQREAHRSALIFLEEVVSNSGQALLKTEVLQRQFESTFGSQLTKYILAWKDTDWYPQALSACFHIFRSFVTMARTSRALELWTSLANEIFSASLGDEANEEMMAFFIQQYRLHGPQTRLDNEAIAAVLYQLVAEEPEDETSISLLAQSFVKGTQNFVLSDGTENKLVFLLSSKLEELVLLREHPSLFPLRVIQRALILDPASSTLDWLLETKPEVVISSFKLRPWEVANPSAAITDLQALAQEVWKTVSSLSSPKIPQLRSRLLADLASSLTSLDDTTNLKVLIAQFLSVLDSLCSNDAEKASAIEEAVPAKATWEALRGAVSAAGASHMISVFRELNSFNRLVPVVPETPVGNSADVKIDQFGLSGYARVVLLTWSLLSHVGPKAFFLPTKGRETLSGRRSWLLYEVLLARSFFIGCHLGLEDSEAKNFLWNNQSAQAVQIVQTFLDRSKNLLKTLLNSLSLSEKEFHSLSQSLFIEIDQMQEDDSVPDEDEEEGAVAPQSEAKAANPPALSPEGDFVKNLVVLALSASMGFQKNAVAKTTSSVTLFSLLQAITENSALPSAVSESLVKLLLVDGTPNFETSVAISLSMGGSVPKDSAAFEAWTQTCTSSFLSIQPSAFYSDQLSIRQTAWKTLSQLTLSLAVFEPSEVSSLTKAFDHTIRALSGTENRAGTQEFFPTNSQMAQLLSIVVRRVSSQLLPNRWNFLFQHMGSWIEIAIKNLSQIEGKILLFHSLQLLQAVWGVTETANPEERKALLPRASEVLPEWQQCKQGMFDALFQVFLDIPKASHYERHQVNFLLLLSRTLALIPEDILLLRRPYEELYHCAHYPQEDVQKTSFSLLRNIVAVENQELSLKEDLRTTADSEGVDLVPASLQLALQEIQVKTLDVHSLLGYLLSWMVVFDFLENPNPRLRFSFAMAVKEADVMAPFLRTLFEVVDVTSGKIPQNVESFDLSRFNIEKDESIIALASHLYWRALKLLPALVRLWWTECNDKLLRNAVEVFTERGFSSSIISHQLSAIKDAETLKYDNMTLRPSLGLKQVTATYGLQDVTIEVVVRLPSNFPLRQVEVDCTQRVGISEMQWRKWLLSITTVIASQNGTIVDALKMWKQDADKKFEGIEECAICYYVVHGSDRSLPKVTCKTCKHKFHGACLYKWFKSSNNSSCPLCRNIF